MKNKREIILDFTSLLDVIMLILFFFVIFAQLGTNNAMDKAEKLQAEAQQKQEEADEEWKKANKALQEAETELKELQQANALAEAIIINGASDFDKALRLKLVLDGNRDDWTISVQFAEEKEGKIEYTKAGAISDVRNRDTDALAKDFELIIIDSGYSKEDAFLCDLMFNSTDGGSNIAEINTEKMIKNFRDDLRYKYVFVSLVDISEWRTMKNEES